MVTTVLRGKVSCQGGDGSFPEGLRRVRVILVRPTHYDQDGFPYRFFLGVMSPSSPWIISSLTRKALEKVGLPSQISWTIRVYDDGVWWSAVRMWLLYLWLSLFRNSSEKVIVGLVGVQQCQFVRARDLMRKWQAIGATCIIGGPHVTGTIRMTEEGLPSSDPRSNRVPCSHQRHPWIEGLERMGVVVFYGEAEPGADGNVWARAISDVLRGEPEFMYRGGQSEIAGHLPAYSSDIRMHGYVTSNFPLVTARGCPHSCSFCTAVNCQGRRVRSYSLEELSEFIEQMCLIEGRAAIFLASDNFPRSKNCRQLLVALNEMRRQGRRISLMCQADVASCTEDFVAAFAGAGGVQVFVGFESVSSVNLAAVGKQQNEVDRYKELCDLCHEYGIKVNAAYMIGFPFDTAWSVKEDVECLLRTGVDLVNFYVVTCLSGSQDWVEALEEGKPAGSEADCNEADSFRPTMDHPRMSSKEWQGVYDWAWRRVYSPGNMSKALQHFERKEDRLRLLAIFMWYWWSVRVEKIHPMIAGLYRFRSFWDRRSDAERISWRRHVLKEAWRHLRYFGYLLAAFYVFQQVVLEVDYGAKVAQRRERLSGGIGWVVDWARLTFGPGTRRWLNDFWVRYARNRWRLLFDPLGWQWHLRMIPFVVSEVVYTVRFAVTFLICFRKLMKS